MGGRKDGDGKAESRGRWGEEDHLREDNSPDHKPMESLSAANAGYQLSQVANRREDALFFSVFLWLLDHNWR